MKEECLICRAPLVYLEADEQMECEICHKKENSKTRCVHGHYVCNDCHTSGLDTVIGLCEAETAKDPIAIIEKMMHLPFCHMHGPEHHVMVGAALLTAYRNAGGRIDLHSALIEMLADDNIRMTHKIEILAERGLRSRIMVYLNVLARKSGSDTVSVKMSREQMAQYLCVNRSALSNELNKMKREGLIDFQRGTFRLLKNGNPEDGDGSGTADPFTGTGKL